MKTRCSVLWKTGGITGEARVSFGRLVALNTRGGSENGARFSCGSGAPARIDLEIDEANLGFGANPTRVTILTPHHTFTFFLRDVQCDYPIYLPEYSVLVTGADDGRDYAAIEQAITVRGGATRLHEIACAPEESFETAAAATRPLRSPTWLGLSRDMRLFELDLTHAGHSYVIRPRLHGVVRCWGEQPLHYVFVAGRGVGCVDALGRRLDQGELPILHAVCTDDDMRYDMTFFATLERAVLTAETLRGTHYLVADGHAAGHRFTPEQQDRFEKLLPEETDPDADEVVLYARIIATNIAPVPRYAWFRTCLPNVETTFEARRGLSLFGDGSAFAVSLLDSQPLPKEEVAVLVFPGRRVTFEFRLAHRGLPPERATALATWNYEDRLAECRRFWQSKLAAAAQIALPEPRIHEMVHAGLLHLELVAYGREPDGPVAPTIGVYSPIGSESAPIIQFIDSMGLPGLAQRCLEYFLEKQHDDGFMQNFDGYMLETGAALWSCGEHYRYTRNDEWVRRFQGQLRKACDYLLAWRRRNQREDLRGTAYGLLDGKVADPEDPFRQFMLNGYACIGLARVAEMLTGVAPDDSAQLAAEAQAFRADIRAAYFAACARSPVVPLGDGRWVPAAPSWAEADAPSYLLTGGQRSFTHGAFVLRESLIGPLYLVLQEVLDPEEPAVDALLQAHCELLHVRNVALSQPYYSRHPLAHLYRGETRAFLKAWYNGVAGLADRETYSFWEHYFHASPHKTHEEGWFLMETRWMLYLERGETLRLLAGVPRAWLAEGRRIAVKGAASYFGPLSFEVRSRLSEKRIVATVACDSSRAPRRVELRLPHPEERVPTHVAGGVYDLRRETVTVEPFAGQAEVELKY